MGSIPHCSAGQPGPCWWSEQANPEDTEGSTAQTVRAMCGEIREAAGDWLVIGSARMTLQAFQHYPFAADPATAIWWFVKHRLKFVQDEITLSRLLNKRGELDFLQSPSILLRARKPQGDCDCFTMLVCALLECAGVPWKICTVKCDAREPWRWSHVYCCAELPDGRRIALDASHGNAPGWEVPARDVFEYAEWDRDGNRLATTMRPTPMGQYRPGLGAARKGLYRPFLIRRRGMGDDTTGDTTATDLAALQASAAAGGADWNSGGYQPIALPVVTNTGPVTSGPNVALDNTLASLATAWTKIAGQSIAPQVTVQGPGGQLITGPASSFAQLTGSLSNLTAGAGGMGNVLLWGGIGVVVIAIAMSLGKK